MKHFMRALLAFLLVFQSGFVRAEDSPNTFKIDPSVDRAISAGLHELYNLNFDEALKIFDTVKDQADEHPMVAFGVASVHWWRLSVYVLEADEQESAEFVRTVNRCIELSKKKIDRGDPTGEAYLTLGGAEGILGRWQAANRDYLTAYFGGKRAYKHLRKALKINPQMYDAYMGLGIFDYYVATLPAIVRALAFIGQGSDPKVGLEELKTAADKGRYSNVASSLFLINIYTILENRPDLSLEMLEKMKVDFPTSPFMSTLKIVALYNHGPDESLKNEAAEYMDRVNKGIYRAEFRTQANFNLGIIEFKNQKWDEAVRYFDEALKTGTPKDPFATWAILYKGYALDAAGKREEAVKEYTEVAKMLRRWGSQDSAKARLKKPFTPQDDEMKKLIL
jgi:tetratricopeptide (TPR) repeat protein